MNVSRLANAQSVYTGESRTELLTWVSDLLQLPVAKIEQMGWVGRIISA